MSKSKQPSNFNASVPELIAQMRSFKARIMSHPAFPLPWPQFVPTPDLLDEEIAYLEEAYKVRSEDDSDIKTLSALNRARWRLKTTFGKLDRYVALTLGGPSDAVSWPGFDLRRNPGGVRSRTPRPPRIVKPGCRYCLDRGKP